MRPRSTDINSDSSFRSRVRVTTSTRFNSAQTPIDSTRIRKCNVECFDAVAIQKCGWYLQRDSFAYSCMQTYVPVHFSSRVDRSLPNFSTARERELDNSSRQIASGYFSSRMNSPPTNGGHEWSVAPTVKPGRKVDVRCSYRALAPSIIPSITVANFQRNSCSVASWRLAALHTRASP